MAATFGFEHGMFLAVGLMALLLAGLVLAGGPRKTVNRALALFLAVVGVNYLADGLIHVVTSDWLSVNLYVLTGLTFALFPFTYLAFLGVALDTPLVRPFRPRVGRWVLAAVAGGLVVVEYVLLRAMSPWVRRPGGGWQSGADATALSAIWGPALATNIRWLAAAVFFFGLLCGIHALLRAPPGSLARTRAKWYVLAFGIQDIGLGLNAAGWLPLPYFFAWGIPLLIALPIVAFALLRYQLFDFGLRVKWTLKQGTVAAIFVAVFFVVSEGAQQIFQESVGPLLGIAAAGMLVFAIAPLQQVAERLSNAAMPNVQPTSTYVQFKKLEVYKAAVETAFEAGYGIDARERVALDRLRAKLDILAEDAAAVEGEVAVLFSRSRATPA